MAAPGRGFESWVGMGEETGGYAVAATRTDFIEIITEGPKVVSPPIKKASLRGFQPRGFFQGTKPVDGDIETEWFYQGAELLLKTFFGDVVTTVAGGETIVFDHLFTPVKVLPSLTLEIFRDQKSFLYPGSKIGQLGYNLVVNQVQRFVYSVMAQDESQLGSPSSPVFPTELLPVFHQAKVEIDSAEHPAVDFNFTANNSLAGERFKLGSRLRKEPVRNDIMNVTGAFTDEFVDLVQYDKFIAGTPFNLKLTVTDTIMIGVAAFNTVIIEFPRAVFTGETPGVTGPGIIPQNFPFEAFASEDLTVPMLKVTLRNLRVSV